MTEKPARKRGGQREGAGRPRKFSFAEQMSIGSRLEERLRLAAEARAHEQREKRIEKETRAAAKDCNPPDFRKRQQDLRGIQEKALARERYHLIEKTKAIISRISGPVPADLRKLLDWLLECERRSIVKTSPSGPRLSDLATFPLEEEGGEGDDEQLPTPPWDEYDADLKPLLDEGAKLLKDKGLIGQQGGFERAALLPLKTPQNRRELAQQIADQFGPGLTATYVERCNKLFRSVFRADMVRAPEGENEAFLREAARNAHCPEDSES